MPPPVVYFDSCALNRLSDDRSQPRIHAEAAAVLQILDLVSANQLIWIASTVLTQEISQNADVIRRIDTLNLLSFAAQTASPTPETLHAARQFTSVGFSSVDALHLAVARQVRANWLFTTDDRLIKTARRKTENRHPEVINPLDWLKRRQA